MKHALPVTREADFSAWYQSVIAEADLAEESGVRGCMVIRPWGYGIWERIQRLLDDRIKATGHENCYFPLFIPLSYFEKEAEHVEGFAKEMAVVTHHRLVSDGKGGLTPDPTAKLEEPLVVRPTSETVIGTAFARWIQSWRDLPVLINQWANVVRWEMRTRMFLRTSEFLWQEGHTAHATPDEAREETLKMLEVYRSFAEGALALPVVAGEKPENERFPGAVSTYSIEAMMQDGKALQAGTSHFLGTNFAHAQNIRFQNADGVFEHANTTSWGVSTRMIGGIIMVHGDDDGLRVPPRVAPWQVVIVPMLRDAPEDAAIVDYCKALQAALAEQTALGEPVRALLDLKPAKAATKRWGWVKKGAPVIVEVGGRDVAGGNVSVVRRDRLYRADGKLDSAVVSRDAFVAEVSATLSDVQRVLFDQAHARLRANIAPVDDWAGVEAAFAPDRKNPGWVDVRWSKPTGAALDAVVERLKALKLTIRNAPMGQTHTDAGPCVFTGEPAVERVLIGRELLMAIWFGDTPDPAAMTAFGDASMPGLLGIVFTQVGDDWLAASMPVDHRTKQPFGRLHGGASVVLAETVASVGGAMTVDRTAKAVVGMEINANHIRAATDGHVHAVAKAESVGRTTQVWTIRITDDAGKLVCLSRITLAVIAVG